MIELTDTIRAVEEFIAPEGPDHSDHGMARARVGDNQGETGPVVVRPTKDHDDTHAFGGMNVNVD
jgi:hypothetical protein